MKEIINFLTWLNKNDSVKNIILKKESAYKESKIIDEKIVENFVKKEIIPIAKANGFNFEAQDYFDFIIKNKSKILSDEDLEYVSGGKKLFVPAILMSMINIAQFGMHTTTYAAPPKPFEALNLQHMDSESIEQNLDIAKNALQELKIKHPKNSREIDDIISFIEECKQSIDEYILGIKFMFDGVSILDTKFDDEIKNLRDVNHILNKYCVVAKEYRSLINDQKEINRLTNEIKQIKDLLKAISETHTGFLDELQNKFEGLIEKINDTNVSEIKTLISEPLLNISGSYNTFLNSITKENKSDPDLKENDRILKSTAEQNFDSVKKGLLEEFNGIDQSLKWKLVIDAEFHGYNNPKVFDEGIDLNGRRVECNIEPGYKDAMLSALDYTFSEECMNTNFDANLYLKIHERACYNVIGYNGSFPKDPISKDFRGMGDSAKFGLEEGRNISSEGKEQFENKKNSPWKSDKLFVYNEKGLDLALGTFETGGILYSFFHAPFPKEDNSIENAVNLIFEEYYDKLQELNSKGYVNGSLISQDSSLDDKKLEIIIRICQNLDQLHAWTDGNIRTITFLVMQRMLIENGLTPAIFDNPNYIDLRSVEEIMEDLKEAQETYRQIVKESETIKNRT